MGTCENLFAKSPYGYLVFDNGDYVDCNKATEKLFDFYREWDLGKSPVEISLEVQPNGQRTDEYAKVLLCRVLMKEGDDCMDLGRFALPAGYRVSA
ncbi:MAG: PAS domain-containing protein [Spirochaetales bacterium]|nr:PAS domain-containing protein [Spirochaetales bacterium]